MSRKVNYTNEDLALAYELRQEGYSWKRIAQLVGLDRKPLYDAVRYVVRNGLK